jgi:hypothetical protein
MDANEPFGAAVLSSNLREFNRDAGVLPTWNLARSNCLAGESQTA